MAFEEVLETRSYEAAGDLSADQYKFVLQNTSDQVAVNTVNGGKITGVLQTKPNAQGRAAEVGVRGVTKVQAGGTIAVGDEIMSNGSGKAVKATTGLVIVGFARTAAANGEICSIELLGYRGVA